MEANAIALDRDDGRVVVAALTGEHDIYTAPSLREQVYGVIEEGKPLVVDLNETTFLDSSVLGVLIGARRRAHEAGLGFAVCCSDGVESGVKRVLEVTGLIPVLPVLPEREQALEHARTGPHDDEDEA